MGERYQEGPAPPTLRDTVQCVWWARARADGDPEAAVLPDGYGPKTFERIARFQRFRRLARAGGPGAGLAALAAACGYADQAHLARECRRLAGRPPSAFLRGRAATPAGAARTSESFKRAPAAAATLER